MRPTRRPHTRAQPAAARAPPPLDAVRRRRHRPDPPPTAHTAPAPPLALYRAGNSGCSGYRDGQYGGDRGEQTVEMARPQHPTLLVSMAWQRPSSVAEAAHPQQGADFSAVAGVVFRGAVVVTARWVWIRLGSGDRSRSWSRTILGSLDVSVAALVQGKGGSHGEGNTQEGSNCFLFQALWDLTLA